MKRLIFSALILISLTACKGEVAGITAEDSLPNEEQPIEPIVGDPGQTPEEPDDEEPVIPGPIGQATTITYYSLSRSATIYARTYTATGYCANVSGRIFCWDDGIKTVDYTYNGIRYFAQNTFWNVKSNDHCQNSCDTDGLLNPVEMRENLFPLNQIDQLSVKKVEDVMEDGIESQMSCEAFTSQIVCGSIIFGI